MDANTAVYHSEIEVQDLLDHLTDQDIARALQSYRVLGCMPRTGLSENDVLNHVVVKALLLERRWPKDLNVASFLITTGKSIISNEEEKHSKLIVSPSIDELSAVDDVQQKTSSATGKLSSPSSESHIERRQSEDVIAIWIQKIRLLFEHDAEADCFITQKLNEKKKSNILTLCNFTDQIYRNVEKRVKDKVKKRFPSGLPWWEVQS